MRHRRIIVSENTLDIFEPKLVENNVTSGRDLPSGKHDVIGIFVIVIKGGLGGVAPQEDYLILIVGTLHFLYAT